MKLSWEADEETREVGGYRIYRSTKSGSGFLALNRTPVTSTTFTDDAPGAGPLFYLAAAVEPSGLEGHFSNEASVGTEAGTLRTLYIEAENCAWSPPLREVIHGSASGARYIRYHRAAPEEPAEGVLRYKVDLPGGGFTAWLRCRSEAKGEDWLWRKTDPGSPPGEIRVTEDGLAIDQICLTNDPADAPAGAPRLTKPPAAVSALSMTKATPQSVELQWEASPAPNVARYDVHVGEAPEELGNETIVGSTTDSTFVDWGLRPGTTYTYQVVAVNSRGQSSKPVSIAAATRARAIQTIASEPQVAGDKTSFAVNVAAEGEFMLWAKYSPAYVASKQLRVGVEIDGKKAGTWRLRAPYRPMGWTLAKKGKGEAHIFVDKVSADGKDVFKLPPGQHTVVLTLDPKLGEDRHIFEQLAASNDHSHRPEGYDPRADFKKSKRMY